MKNIQTTIKNSYGGDMTFWTYYNPKEFTSTCGFDEKNELRITEMLTFKNVKKQKNHYEVNQLNV